MWLSLKTSVSIWLVLGLFFAYHPKLYTEEMKCDQPVDVIILIDGSDSISDNDWVRSKNFVKELIDSFDIGQDTIHVGIIVYSSNIGDVIGLKKFHSKETLKFLANRLHHPKDGTDTAAGIRKVTKMMEAESRPNAARVAIVITDGRSSHPIQTTQEALKAKSAGIVMLTVGVGHAISRAELSQIATSEREMFDVSDFSGLQGVVGILRKLLCKIIVTTTLTSITAKTTKSSAATSATSTKRKETLVLKLSKSSEQGNLQSLCKGCIIDRGIGYSSHHNDCTKYVQCFRENGEYRAKLMSCPFGTYWDQNKITCWHSHLVNCTTDACLVTQKDSTFAMRDHCAGYWSCHYGRAEAKCCQRNHRYVQGKGCQPDGSCNQLCPHFKNTVENNDKSECELLTDENNPSSYIQIVPGIGPISRPCAPGSAFDKSMCSCAKVSKSWKSHVECKPSVSYNFNVDFADQSGNNVFAGYERVDITENGTAKFSDGSRINIWRFANVEFSEKLLLKLRFLKYNYGAVEQPIVTNCYGEHGEGSSIAITIVEQSITIKIKTELGETGILRFFQVPGFNNVTMVYDGQHVIAKVNGKIKSTALIGNIERRQAGLLIGDCDGQHSFHGEIDYFAVYMCLPNEDIFQRVALTQRRDIV
ncbi:protein PIF isoform X1 [Octopus bimaculoides]|nr:protein PIF isoform X1 [Octopus bimaculoides]